jgi:hypothetical protein
LKTCIIFLIIIFQLQVFRDRSTRRAEFSLPCSQSYQQGVQKVLGYPWLTAISQVLDEVSAAPQ